MREIKFRVFWVNKMLFTDKGDFVIYRGTPRLNEYGDMIGMSNCSDLMQYTGLKDMHGKEIYEGDIVKTRGGDICVIKYVNTGFYPMRNKSGTYNKSTNWDSVKNGEVIGNICESEEVI